MSTFPADVVLDVVDIIRQAGRTPLLVGIDGPGGAGKSTLAREIAEGLDHSAVVVAGDDFYSATPAAQNAELTAEEGVEQYFDWRRLRREVLLPTSEAAEILRYRRYDWNHEKMGGWVEIPMPAVVIVEGIYTLRPELHDLFDVKICVATTEDVRLRRQQDRGENSDEWIARWMAAEHAYFATRSPTLLADVVVISGGRLRNDPPST